MSLKQTLRTRPRTFFVTFAVFTLCVPLALLSVGCDIFDDDDDSPSPSTTLSVYGTDAPGDVTEFTVTLTDVSVGNSPNELQSLTPVGDDNAVDLVAASDSVPGFLSQFELEPGSYSCVAATVAVSSFSVENGSGGADACDTLTNFPANELSFSVCVPAPLFVVSDGGDIELVIDIPLDNQTVAASCDPNTGEGTVQPLNAMIFPR